MTQYSEAYKKLQEMARIYQKNNPQAAKNEERRLKAKFEKLREIARNKPIHIKTIPVAKPVAFVLKSIEQSKMVKSKGKVGKYKERLFVPRGNVFKQRTLKIWTLNWSSPKKEERTATICISEEVWIRIILLSQKLKNKNYEQGKILLYYRYDLTSILLAFATDKQYVEYISPILKRNIKQEIRNKIPWYEPSGKVNEELFDKYYRGDLIETRTNN